MSDMLWSLLQKSRRRVGILFVLVRVISWIVFTGPE